MATRYSSFIPGVTNGLVLYLDAAKRESYPGSGTTWYDLSGNGNNGTLTNGPTYTGVSKDAAIDFDGVNDYVNLNTTFSSIVSSSLPSTWNAWVNVVSSSSNRTIIGSAWANGGVHMRLTGSSHAPQDRVRFLHFTDGSNGTGFDSSLTFTSGWQNFTAIYNGNGLVYSNFKFYLNGQEAATTDPTFGSPTVVPTTQTFSVGRGGTEDQAYYNSNIAQVSVYNRALTASEIQQNYNALKGRYGL